MIRFLLLLLFPCLAFSQNYWEHFKRNTPSYSATFLTGSFDGVADVLQFKYQESVFPQKGEKGFGYWNPKVSWERKYSVGYPLSETALVRFTDGWHLAKGFRNDFNSIAVMSYTKPPTGEWEYYIYDFLVMFAARSAGWHFTNYLTRHDY